jgi:hypothetical protein
VSDLTIENAIFGHTSEETALLVDDYPYGFRLRTSIRYWLETTKHGDRFCSQTLNPKTGRWNKPKCSTYCRVGCLYHDEKGHVTWTGLGEWANDDFIKHFLIVTGAHLTVKQRAEVARIIGLNAAFADVEWVIHEGPSTPEREAEQDKIKGYINRRVAVETHKAAVELDVR